MVPWVDLVHIHSILVLHICDQILEHETRVECSQVPAPEPSSGEMRQVILDGEDVSLEEGEFITVRELGVGEESDHTSRIHYRFRGTDWEDESFTEQEI